MSDDENIRAHEPRFVSTALSSSRVRVWSLRGADELSSLFEFQVVLQIDQDDRIDTDQLLGAPAALYWSAHGIPQAPWYGVVREAELLEARPNCWVHYRVVLVPHLWFATQTFRSRVFPGKSVPEVVNAVLGETGLVEGTDYEWHLTRPEDYPVREYLVQYRESDFDFVARLLEREGIFFFSHGDGGHEKWALADHNDAFVAPLEPEVSFSLQMTDGGDTLQRRFHSFTERHSSVPAHLVTRDYNDRIPSVNLQSYQPVSPQGLGLVFLSDDLLLDDHAATRVGRIRAEELAVQERTYRGRGSVLDIRVGQRIEVQSHPIGDLNGAYVVIGLEIEQVGGDVGVTPTVTAELIRADVPCRPPRITRQPRIYGIVAGHVDGEVVGVPAPLDDQGRYKVLLPFDAAGTPGGRASHWIRMAQTFAGPGYGMHFPLHVGTEVLLAHLDGDPDRPIIVGAVPNPDTLTPVLDANATQSVVRTKGGIIQEYEDDARVDDGN